jgi:hypothetical protein
MKTRHRTRFTGQLGILVLLGSWVCSASAQSSQGGGGGAGGGGGGANGSGGSQAAGAQQEGSPSSAPSGRIEATMLAYDASEKIAEHIKGLVGGHRLYIYDSQTFASIQTYDSYAATVGTFETSFRLLTESAADAMHDVDEAKSSLASAMATDSGLSPTLKPPPPTVGEAEAKVQEAAPSANAPAGTSILGNPIVSGVQTVVSTLAALRSSTEFAAQAVDFNTDALTAQVARQLPGSVVVPKMFLFSSDDDLRAFDPHSLPGNCSGLTETVPQQLGCLLKLRNDLERSVNQQSSTVAVMGTQVSTLQSDIGTVMAHLPNAAGSDKALGETFVRQAREAVDRAARAIQSSKDSTSAFATIDKFFQGFFASMVGAASASSSSQTPTNASKTDGSNPLAIKITSGTPGANPNISVNLGSGNNPAPGNNTNPGSNPNPSPGAANANPNPGTSALPTIIQGRRLKLQLLDGHSDSRVLVLEATAAGGGSRIRHNFWVEVFYTTPDPAFTGGAIVTYMLLNPVTSTVESADVLRYDYTYGKFHGKKSQKPCNFPPCPK